MNSNLTIIAYKEGKSWWAYCVDAEDNQVGHAEFAHTKKLAIKYLREQHDMDTE